MFNLNKVFFGINYSAFSASIASLVGRVFFSTVTTFLRAGWEERSIFGGMMKSCGSGGKQKVKGTSFKICVCCNCFFVIINSVDNLSIISN